MRLMGVAVWRSVLRGALISIVAGLAASASAQIVTATGSVKLNGDPNLVPSARKAVTYTAAAASSNAVINAEAVDNLSPEAGSNTDGWPDELHIRVSPNATVPFQIVFYGVKSNIMTGSYCETSGGRTTCDPQVSLQDLAGNPLCTVAKSSFNITKTRFGYGGTDDKPSLVFVYSLGGNFSAQCAGETLPITGSFNINQTTTKKFLTTPRTSIEAGTARCNGAGGWPATGFLCDPSPPIPTAELPRSGILTVTLTAEPGADLGRITPGKTYRWSNTDGPWFTYLRDPLTDQSLRSYAGAPPNHFELSLDVQSSARERLGVFNFSFKQRQDPIDVGAFDFADIQGHPHMEVQINLSFCGGGVTSTYTVEEFTYDCEFSQGGVSPDIGAPPSPVHVVPHLRNFKVNFRTKCGDEKGAFKGTISLRDNPGFDCGFPPSTGGGGTSGGDGGSGDLDGGDTGSGGSTGDTGSGGSTGGGTSSNGPSIVVPDSVRSGIQLTNQQAMTVDLSTAIPSGFNADVELAAFSEPEGLAVSLSKTAIAAPGTGTSVLTIAAGANTRPQDYRVILSATGNGVTTYSVIKVSILCDPPVILGIDQPRNVTINSGASTTLEVKANGSPAVFQWYAGQTGSTQTPIPGATNRTFNTGALTSTKDYWVRATNPCGSVDSNTVTVTVH